MNVSSKLFYKVNETKYQYYVLSILDCGRNEFPNGEAHLSWWLGYEECSVNRHIGCKSIWFWFIATTIYGFDGPPRRHQVSKWWKNFIHALAMASARDIDKPEAYTWEKRRLELWRLNMGGISTGKRAIRNV